MAKLNPMSALQLLLQIDTNLFKEELYYPWFIQKPGILSISGSWVLFMVMLTTLLLLFTNMAWFLPIIIAAVLSGIFAISYLVIISQSKKAAQKAALQQMMRLEKQQFMKNIEPFVSADQKGLVKRIATKVDFSPNEYISLALATKSRAVFNTDACIQDIERLFADKKYRGADFDDSGYSDTVFRVPDSAKKNYEKMRNSSTFNDELEVTPQAQAAILKKVRDAMDRQALGREV